MNDEISADMRIQTIQSEVHELARTPLSGEQIERLGTVAMALATMMVTASKSLGQQDLDDPSLGAGGSVEAYRG